MALCTPRLLGVSKISKDPRKRVSYLDNLIRTVVDITMNKKFIIK